MSSRANEYPRAAKILAAIGLTAQLAAAATNGIPVAQQVTGVVARLVKSAEDIEKQRDALHQLAETARKLGLSIDAVTAGRKLGEHVEHSLKGINIVCHAIEAVFAKHKAKHPMRKALSYAFTTSKEVEALSDELSRAAKQFELVAAVDNNARLRETDAQLQEINIRLQEDSQYIGEVDPQLGQTADALRARQFRHIRHSDVKSLQLIAERDVWFTGYKIRIYSAKVDRSVCILRCFARRAGREGKSGSDSWHRQQVIKHDQLLEELSMVQNLHPNIARLYGRSSKEHFDRFNVMNLGYVPAIGVKQKAETPDWGWNIIEQIVDALCHLKDCGASWEPELENPVFLDGNGAPIIGLHNDLRSFDTRWHLWQLKALGEILKHGLRRSWKQSLSHYNEEHAPVIHSSAMRSLKPYFHERCSIPRRFIRTLNEKVSAYIATALADFNDPSYIWEETGPVVLRAAASGRKVGSAFYTRYFARCKHAGDSIYLYRAEESDDKLVHVKTRVDVPTSMTDEFRTKLGITLPVPAPAIESFFSTRDPAEPGSMSFRPFFL